MKSNELDPNWSLDRLSGQTACTEQWRHVTDTNDPTFVNTSVAKVYSDFKVSNVNKVNICLWNRFNSSCMLFLSMYTFIIYMGNCQIKLQIGIPKFSILKLE